MGKALGVVHVFVARQAALHRLPQQVGLWELCVLTLSGISQVLIDQIAKAQPLVQLAHENQATVGGDSRSLKICLLYTSDAADE